MTLDELKQQISSGQITLDRSKITCVEEGNLRNSLGGMVKYTVSHGWDILSSIDCNDSWSRSNLELLTYIEQQKFNDAKLKDVLNSIQTEDFHWDWFLKSYKFRSEEYEWFYLYADEKPQGACVIFHPKDSALGDSKIFYVEFIAVAPWNRDCLIRKRVLYGVGSTLLKAALRFSTDKLGLKPGFSLHSLPQAKSYYEKIKMVNVKERDKDELIYFELPQDQALLLLEAT